MVANEKADTLSRQSATALRHALPPFSPLHLKSDYSLGFGTAAVEQLAAAAAERGYSALTLSDIENLYAQVRFHAACRKYGLRAISGVELRPGFVSGRSPGMQTGRLVLLAADRAGYANLCRIVSRRRCGAGAGKGPKAAGQEVTAHLDGRTAGLFALSDDPDVLSGLLAQGLFAPDRLGLLAVRPAPHSDSETLRGLARRLGVALVADLDAFLLDPGDYDLHLLQMAVQQGRRFSEVAGAAPAGSRQRLLRSAVQAQALFADLPEALEAAARIAESCRLEPAGENAARADAHNDAGAAAHLRSLCERALSQRRSQDREWSAAHVARLAKELALFERLGFAGLLAMVGEILTFCREQDIAVVARGSAVSSLTLHLLGGSPVDPLREGLLLERFLHAGKTQWPDVDLDLQWDRRDEVIAWVYERFGRRQVAMVAAHHCFQRRAALREGLKAMGARPAQIEALAGALPSEELSLADADFLGLAQRVEEAEPEPAATGDSFDLGYVLPLVQRLVGHPSHIATHPGGIVIGAAPLEESLPLERAPKGVVITQYDLSAVAALGLVKIDLLGNRCLSELVETLRLAGRPQQLEAIATGDPEALSLVDRAETIGCCQLESPAMRSLLARLPVRRQSDLTAALALIRPGAAAGAAKEAFVRRARGEAPPAIAEPLLAERLKETYGLLLYEEDIMVLISRVGGLSLDEADRLRAAIVASGGDELVLSALEERFLQAAGRHLGPAGRLRAAAAWQAAARFAAYSFNKAHAASYARIAYLAAYMKAHHPLQFACALLNHHQGLYPLRTLAAEFTRMGIAVLPPHIQHSEYASRIESQNPAAGRPAIRVGLDKIKGLSQRAAAALLLERAGRGPFRSLRDLLERVHFSSRERRVLIMCGACDGLSPLDPARYPMANEWVLKQLKEGRTPADLEDLPLPAQPPPSKPFQLYQALVRIQNELPILNMHLSAHPLALLRSEAERYGCIFIREAGSRAAGVEVRLSAIVAAMRRVKSKRGILQFATLEDESGLLEAVVLPPVYARTGNRITTPGPFLVQGHLRRRHGAAYLEVEHMEPFHQRPMPYSKP